MKAFPILISLGLLAAADVQGRKLGDQTVRVLKSASPEQKVLLKSMKLANVQAPARQIARARLMATAHQHALPLVAAPLVWSQAVVLDLLKQAALRRRKQLSPSHIVNEPMFGAPATRVYVGFTPYYRKSAADSLLKTGGGLRVVKNNIALLRHAVNEPAYGARANRLYGTVNPYFMTRAAGREWSKSILIIFTDGYPESRVKSITPMDILRARRIRGERA